MAQEPWGVRLLYRMQITQLLSQIIQTTLFGGEIKNEGTRNVVNDSSLQQKAFPLAPLSFEFV